MGQRQQMVAMAGALLVLMVGATLLLRKGTTCANREDAEARLATVTAQLQQLASRHGMSTQAFAGALKDLNDAAAVLDAHKDPKAYCERLAAIAKEHAADE